MENFEGQLSNRLEQLIDGNTLFPKKRIVVAFAGAPGSGKSTVASSLMRAFNAKHREQLLVVPMDGFHHTQSTLSTMQSHECPFRRRGAPFTFDSERFVKVVQALSQAPVTEDDESEKAFWVPSFDHAIKDPVENDIRISSAQKIVLLEGSYLLLDEHPWCMIRELVDETWFISVSRDVSKKRLVLRHLEAGIEIDSEAAVVRTETNDLLNWDLVNEKLLDPHVVIKSN